MILTFVSLRLTGVCSLVSMLGLRAVPFIQFSLGVGKGTVISIQTPPPILNVHTQSESCDVKGEGWFSPGLSTIWSKVSVRIGSCLLFVIA